MVSSQCDTGKTQKSLRQRWIGAFAQCSEATLSSILETHGEGQQFVVIRPAEHGLVMTRARAGGSGTLFNAGEMSVTRCSVRGQEGRMGHGYVAGRNKTHAECAAKLDALMQSIDPTEVEKIILPIEQGIDDRRKARQAASAPSKVEFLTMVRGENA